MTTLTLTPESVGLFRYDLVGEATYTVRAPDHGSWSGVSGATLVTDAGGIDGDRWDLDYGVGPASVSQTITLPSGTYKVYVRSYTSTVASGQKLTYDTTDLTIPENSSYSDPTVETVDTYDNMRYLGEITSTGSAETLTISGPTSGSGSGTVVDNSDFETDLDGWSADTNLVRSTAEAHGGTYSVGTTVAINFTVDRNLSKTIVVPTGGATLTYWINVNSDVNYHRLQLRVDGALIHNNANTSGWEQKTYSLAAGSRTIQFRWKWDAEDDEPEDYMYIDDIDVSTASSAASLKFGGVVFEQPSTNTTVTYLADNDIEVGTVLDSHQGAGFARFTVPVDQNDNIAISNAAITVPVNNYTGTGSMKVFVGVVQSDDEADPGDAATAETEMDAASVLGWTFTPVIGVDAVSVDLSEILEPVFQRSGWVNGNDILLYFSTTETVDRIVTFDKDDLELSFDFLYQPPDDAGAQNVILDLTADTFPSGELPVTVEVEQPAEFTFTPTFALDLTRSIEQVATFSFDLSVEAVQRVQQELFVTFDVTGGVSNDVQQELVVDFVTDFVTESGNSTTADLSVIPQATFTLERILEISQNISVSFEAKPSQASGAAEEVLSVSFTVDTSDSVISNSVTQDATFDFTPTYEVEATKSVQQELAVSFTIVASLNFDAGRPYYESGNASNDPNNVVTGANGPLGGANPGSRWGIGSPSATGCNRQDMLHTFGSEPSVTPRDTFTIEYDGTTVTLRAPELSNRINIQKTRIQRDTLHGNKKVYADTAWIEQETFFWAFEGLSKTTKDALVALLADSLGKTVTIVTHETRTYQGYILNPDTDITELRTNCGFATELRFQGVEQ